MLNWNNIIHFANKGTPAPSRRAEKSEEEWKEQLTESQYQITRKHYTERPHSGEYCATHEAGKYTCVCCGEPLFDSSIKFESGTGWPSFTAPIAENAVKYIKDTSHGMTRVETVCNVCDAHLGHVFPDGPAPSGLRYCINSEALKLAQENES